MEFEEAERIFKAWQSFVEVWDKFHRFMLPIPPSFYPYPPEKLDQGLTMMEEFYAKRGDIKMANSIQSTRMSLIGCPESDGEALEHMKRMIDMTLENPKLKETLLEKLHEVRDSWLKLREERKITDK